MAGVVARYGETGATPYLMPFSVDGLVIVASVCLVELAGRIRAATEPATDPISEPASDAMQATVPAVTATPADATASATTDATSTANSPASPVKPPANSPARSPRPKVSRRPASADKVAKVAARMPDATVAAIAAKAGVSESTARRYLPGRTTPVTPAAAATVASANPARPAQTPILADADPAPVAA
jgi:hypothetical protein